MIYIFANTAPEATRYAKFALIHDFISVNYGEMAPVMHEDDEVFILDNCSVALKQAARRQYGAVFPRPHLFMEVKPVPTAKNALLVS